MRIGLLYGGWSHEAYLSAAPAVAAALKRNGHDVVSIQTGDTSLVQQLQSAKLDVAFLGSHGFYHEDGRLQGLCDWIDLPYTGSNHFASALCMNKLQFKRAVEHLGENSFPFAEIASSDTAPDFEDVCQNMKSDKLILKPITSGASVGLTFVKSEAEYSTALMEIIPVYGELLVEPFIQNAREFSVTVHDFDGVPNVLVPCELLTNGELFDFEMKNGYKVLEKELPAKISIEATEKLQDLTAAVYVGLGLDGLARLDVMVNDSGKMHILEANTLPGLMPQSVAPAAFAEIGVSYDQLIENIVQRAFKPKRFETEKQTSGQPKLASEAA